MRTTPMGAALLAAIGWLSAVAAQEPKSTRVTVDNFKRAGKINGEKSN